jgi:hypothetical protein
MQNRPAVIAAAGTDGKNSYGESSGGGDMMVDLKKPRKK